MIAKGALIKMGVAYLIIIFVHLCILYLKKDAQASLNHGTAQLSLQLKIAAVTIEVCSVPEEYRYRGIGTGVSESRGWSGDGVIYSYLRVATVPKFPLTILEQKLCEVKSATMHTHTKSEEGGGGHFLFP